MDIFRRRGILFDFPAKVFEFIFSTVAYFTKGWAELTIEHVFWRLIGLYPWGDTEDQQEWWNQAPWWYLVTWTIMTVVLIVQLLTLIVTIAVIIKKKNTLGVHKTNLVVSSLCCILLSFAMALWGTKYLQERESSEISGLYVSVGYSYWLLFVAVIFSVLDVMICGYIYHCYTLRRRNESHCENNAFEE